MPEYFVVVPKPKRKVTANDIAAIDGILGAFDLIEYDLIPNPLDGSSVKLKIISTPLYQDKESSFIDAMRKIGYLAEKSRP
ncbi:hypothetical protein J4212_08315 [Candidatus Woesearchaeota archaeon]|nr:hypothetical protein [Candidatus Woesearchaeota archaeon]